MKTPLEILRCARDLIADRSRWTQGKYAVDAYGYTVASYDPSAVRWCAKGAVRHCASDINEAGPVHHLLGNTTRDIFGSTSGVVSVNDDYGVPPQQAHANVLRVLDETIARLEREQEESS